jgi:hypothetical protein
MTNVQDRREKEPVGVAAGDFFVVTGADFSAVVSTAMARHIEACLDRKPWARWVTFVDRSGSRFRVRVGQIQSICQSTTEQRQMDREFYRALHNEKKADQGFDD